MKDCRMGKEKFVEAQRMKRLRSVLEIPPIGLISAELQSYHLLVRIRIRLWEIAIVHIWSLVER